jgi:transcriptional regulator with XRE-family HTH domain
MSDFGSELARLMDARGTGVRQLARAVYVNPGHVSNLRSGKARPSPELAAILDEHLQAGGSLAELAAQGPRPPAAADGDEIAAIELARRAGASDVGDGTCERLELAADDLAVAYPRTDPGDLIGRVRAHLGYTAQLLVGRATLAQRRRLMVSGGWLSLLAATVLTDLHQDHGAVAYLRTAGQLAAEAGHAEIAAWVLETRAWMALTAGDYPAALALSQGAREAAPRGGSAFIQATGQEGRARARLGDAPGTRAVLARIEALTSSLPVPDRPEHHFRYDPSKAEAYTATTLSWAGDPAAERFARDVLERLEAPASGPPRHRRASSARIDLALALAGQDKHDEAAGITLQAVTSGWLVPSNYWRAREVISAVAGRGLPEAAGLADAYRAETGRPRELPAGPVSLTARCADADAPAGLARGGVPHAAGGLGGGLAGLVFSPGAQRS